MSKNANKTERSVVISNDIIDSKDLLSNKKELIITHESEIYRLRITSNQKLILTK